MGNTRDLSIVLKLRNQVSKELGQVEGRLQQMKPTFRRMAAGGTAAFAGITAGIGKAVNEARKAQDIDTLFGLAFKEVEDDARQMVTTMTEEMGRAESQIQETVANSAFQLRSMTSMSEQEMLDLAESMVPATEGLALLDGRVESGAQVMQAFTDALAGSRQQFNRLVTPVNDKIIRDKALAEGIIEQGEELTKTKEAMALYAIFMDNTTAAQEIMERESRGFTDSLKQLEAAWITLQQNAGEPFIDLVADVVNKITPLLARVGEWIEKNPELARNIALVAAAIAGLVAVAGTLGLLLLTITGTALIFTGAIAGIGAIGFVVAKNWETISDKIGSLWTSLVEHPFVQRAMAIIKDGIERLRPSIQNLMTALGDLWGSLKELWVLIEPVIMPILRALAGVLGLVLLGAIMVIIDGVNLFVNALGGLVTVFEYVTRTITYSIKGWVKFFTWLWNVLFGNSIIPDMQAGFKFFADTVRKIFETLRSAFKTIWEGIVSVFESAGDIISGIMDRIISTSQRAIDLARQARDLAGGAIGGARDRIGGAISRVTPFADGGIVTQPTLGLVGEAGPEAIIPLNRQNGLGNTYNIIFKGNSFMGEDDLAEQVGDKLMDVIKQTTKISYGY